MKYREAGEMCSRGCGRERAKGQRYCKQCRAEAERARRAKKNEEYRELVAFKARTVAEQLRRLNGEAA